MVDIRASLEQKLLILLPIMIMGREQESGTTDDGSERAIRRNRLHIHAIWQIYGIEDMWSCLYFYYVALILGY